MHISNKYCIYINIFINKYSFCTHILPRGEGSSSKSNISKEITVNQTQLFRVALQKT